jgi:hypothetical protein
MSRQRLGLLLGFVGMAIFGGTLPATRIAVSAIDPIALTALRTAIAGLCSLALLLVLRRPLPPRRLWFQLGIAMLCVSVLFPFLMALAVQTVDASHGGVVLGILPIATALVAVLITHERPQPLFWIASMAGATLVSVGRRYYENVLAKTINRLADYLAVHVTTKDLVIDDCQLAASQFMQMCQASLFLQFIFQAAPPPSAERIAEVVESATRMFLAAYQVKPA